MSAITGRGVVYESTRAEVAESLESLARFARRAVSVLDSAESTAEERWRATCDLRGLASTLDAIGAGLLAERGA